MLHTHSLGAGAACCSGRERDGVSAPAAAAAAAAAGVKDDGRQHRSHLRLCSPRINVAVERHQLWRRRHQASQHLRPRGRGQGAARVDWACSRRIRSPQPGTQQQGRASSCRQRCWHSCAGPPAPASPLGHTASCSAGHQGTRSPLFAAAMEWALAVSKQASGAAAQRLRGTPLHSHLFTCRPAAGQRAGAGDAGAQLRRRGVWPGRELAVPARGG